MKEKINKILEKLPPGFKQVFSNVSRQFGGQFFQLGVGLLIGAWFARYLGPENYGLYNYAAAIVSIMAIFSTLGLDGIVVRELVKYPEKQNELIGTAFFMKLIGGFIVILSSCAIVYSMNSNQSLALRLTLILSSVYLVHAFNSIDFFFQAKLLSKYNVVSINIAFVSGLILRLIGIILAFNIIYFAVISVVEACIAFIFFIYFYNKSGEHIFKWNFNVSLGKKLLKNSRPLIFSSIFAIIYMRIDQVMIKNMLGDLELGIYSVAVKLAEVPNFIASMTAASLFPAIINYRKNKELYKIRLQQFYKIFALIAVIIAIFTTILSPFIVGFLFGNQYSESAVILSLYIWSLVPIFLQTANARYILSENLVKISLYRASLGAIINIILNLILIPIYGLIGAAISTIISYSISAFSIILIKRTRENGIMMLKSLNIINSIIGFRSIIKNLK